MVFFRISHTLLILGTFVLLSAPRPALCAQKGNILHHKVVETLLDTDNQKAADGTLHVNQDQVRKHLRRDSFGGTTFSRVSTSDYTSPEIEYRFTIGRANTSYLKRQWWSKVSSDDFEVWARKVSDYSGAYLELLAIQPVEGYVFEVRLLSPSLKEGLSKVRKKMRLFYSNAEKNGVFDESNEALTVSLNKAKRKQKKTKTTAAKVAKQPSAKLEAIAPAQALLGIWKGPMKNSKGGAAAQSTLHIKRKKDGQYHGTWHAGWIFNKAKQVGNSLIFEVKKVANGCKDYRVQFAMASHGKSGKLKYVAHDRCGSVTSYTGTAELSKQ